jgi:hypothetical protein
MNDQINVPGLLQEAAPQPLSVAVTVHGTQAVLHFSEPREYTAFMAQEALMIGARFMLAAVEADGNSAQAAIATAMAVIDGVYELRGDIKPAGGAVKHELIERHRSKLTQRLAVMLNSMREKKKVSNEELSKNLVDVMLKEVFS